MTEQSHYVDFLYNSIQQDRLTVWKTLQVEGRTRTPKIYRSTIECGKTHHFFIYEGQYHYLGLDSGGKTKNERRERSKDKIPNLYNLMEQVWQCKNTYLSVCEDAAHGFTKGLNTVFKIGKSKPNQKSKMDCRDNLDQKEISDTEVFIVDDIPDRDATPFAGDPSRMKFSKMRQTSAGWC